jgi:S-methylmethionine-dependent homocysteine/selenocysteine methylase
MRSSGVRQLPTCPCSSSDVIADFYREEFLKRQAQLRQQREYYSERAVAGAEAALDLILMRIETLSTLDHAEQLVSRLLRCIDTATGCLVADDPKKVH